MSLLPPRRRRVEMNLLPLIDVLVMLIFFAFVTMQFRRFTTLSITLPSIESAGSEGLKDPLEIGIDTSGAFSVNGEVVSEDAMVQRVQQLAARAGPDMPVLVRVDQDAPVKHVTRVMDVCSAANLKRIRLQSQSRAE